MPVITFLPSQKVVEVVEGTTLFDAATRAGLPVASSCGAEFVCGRCNMTVVLGGENLVPQTYEEQNLLERQGRPRTDRISCVTKVVGNCTVTTTYW